MGEHRPYMQKWLSLNNYSFVRIQNSLNNLVRNDTFFTILSQNEDSVANLNTDKRVI